MDVRLVMQTHCCLYSSTYRFDERQAPSNRKKTLKKTVLTQSRG